ncbi:hypothetical protein pb186bvf_010796 [Paramecium bursaria]
MDLIRSKEGKLLYYLYDLMKQNIISRGQQGDLKDLLVQGDLKMVQIIDNYLITNNKEETNRKLIELTQRTSSWNFEVCSLSDESYSIKSVQSNFKQKRPRPLIPQQKKWFCKSTEIFDHYPKRLGTSHNIEIQLIDNRNSQISLIKTDL